jgi:hypothetical protein
MRQSSANNPPFASALRWAASLFFAWVPQRGGLCPNPGKKMPKAEGFAQTPRQGKAFRRGIAPAVRSKSGSGVGGKGVQKVVKQTPQVKNKKMCFQNIFRMNNFYFQKILKILQKKKMHDKI